MALKQDFVRALRSGQYKQITDGRLRSEAGVCALGVLGKVLAIRKGTVGDILNDPDYLLQFVEPVVGNTIAEMNDSGKSFETIAAFVESTLTDNLKMIAATVAIAA
jgi:hypothetical protein